MEDLPTYETDPLAINCPSCGGPVLVQLAAEPDDRGPSDWICPHCQKEQHTPFGRRLVAVEIVQA
jgi:hypothetical protein